MLIITYKDFQVLRMAKLITFHENIELMIIESLRTIIGMFLILFVPGYALTWAFFPKRTDKTTGERIALSLVMSISGVMFSVLFADIVLEVDTTPVNIVIIILSLTFLAILVWRMHLYIIDKELKRKAIHGFFVTINKCRESITKIKSYKLIKKT